MRQEGTNIVECMIYKDGCEAGNDVWTGDSCRGGKETGETGTSSRKANVEVFNSRNEHTIGTLTVDRLGQNVRQSVLRWRDHAKRRGNIRM